MWLVDLSALDFSTDFTQEQNRRSDQQTIAPRTKNESANGVSKWSTLMEIDRVHQMRVNQCLTCQSADGTVVVLVLQGFEKTQDRRYPCKDCSHCPPFPQFTARYSERKWVAVPLDISSIMTQLYHYHPSLISPSCYKFCTSGKTLTRAC